jgi:predicted AAA+ superfamily ATPase
MMSENIQKYRFLTRFLPSTKSRRLTLITGARQTGKTTLAKANYPKLNYINLDSPENREAIRLISAANWARDVRNAIIDEAQKEPVVFDKIKYAYDAEEISFCVILGSSQIFLLKRIRESLAGRVSIYELYPLLMSELSTAYTADEVNPPFLDRFFSTDDFTLILNSVPAILLDKQDSICKDAEDYLLKWGGMPALLPLAEEERWRWLKDYEYTYLERDLADLARLNDLEPFRKFQKLSALRSARLLNYSDLASNASISVDTAKRYLEYLKISYQTILLQPYYKNITSSVIKTPKIYWLDIGLLRQLCGYRGEVSGEIYETMVVAEVFKWIKTAQKNAELYFYRTRSGLEVDLFLKTEGGIIGMEIKGRKKLGIADTRQLKEVAMGLNSDWRGGIIVYRGDEIKKIAEPNIWAIPSRRLFT